MNLYDAVMKGPPKWFIRATIALIILVVGVQLGLRQERSNQTAKAIHEMIAKKDAEVDQARIALNIAQSDLAIEKAKLKIIMCESEGRHVGLWGDGRRAYGAAQFHRPTFRWLKLKAKRPDLDIKSKADQLWLLDWALRYGYGNQWTCFKTECGGKI